MPDASYNRLVCIAAIVSLHCSKINETGTPDSKRPPETGGLGILCSLRVGLFGRLLPRRIERAGIVDLGHLVIAEAEHLAQDLVGVLAEQRGARHLAR